MTAMASWADMRARQRVRIALSKGKPIPLEDYGAVQKVLEQQVWLRPAALCWVVCWCVWFGVLLSPHATYRWTAVLWMVTSGVMVWSLLRTRKRVLAGATKMGFRRRT